MKKRNDDEEEFEEHSEMFDTVSDLDDYLKKLIQNNSDSCLSVFFTEIFAKTLGAMILDFPFQLFGFLCLKFCSFVLHFTSKWIKGAKNDSRHDFKRSIFKR